MPRINAVTCASWVPKGAARQNPDKVEISAEDLARIIEETKENLDDLEELDEKKYSELEVKVLEEELLKPSKKQLQERKEDKDDEKPETDDKELEEIIKRYKFGTYDVEKDTLDTLNKLGKLTVHADTKDDPNITTKDIDDESEKDSHRILPTDNLIAVGHLDGDAAILEVYVYNSSEDSFYVHHDILLPAIPLCTEWLNTDPGDENLAPSNMIAIGTMSPVIEVWDLDIVDSLEPAFKLGRASKKKKKLSGLGHQDAVLSLAWNKELEHLLASGSVDETVILWDLHDCKAKQRLTHFRDKVQCLQWHPKETHCLLTGSCDKYVRMFDCRTEDTHKDWKLDGEIESITWDITGTQPFQCLASTDQGTIYCVDARKDKPLWDVKAHNAACTGLALSPSCPGCLVSVSEDEIIKIWDTASGKPQLVIEKNPKLGVIHCVSSCVDEAFVFCFGGDNKTTNFKVWDIRQFKKVRQTFCPRVGLSLDEDVEDASCDDDDSHVSEHSEDDEVEDYRQDKMEVDDEPQTHKKKSKRKKKLKESQNSASAAVPVLLKKKKRKKKGGHLDRK